MVKKYSKMNDLPIGEASNVYLRDDACIVCEGGAFRALYETGVLDAMMMNDMNFKNFVGVSAGTMNGLNYVSGQIGRSIRIDLGYRHDTRYVGLGAYLKDRGVIGFKFLFEGMDKGDVCLPLDKDRFLNAPVRFVCVATNCRTGQAEYLEYSDFEHRCKAIKASSSMPYVSKMVDIDGQLYLDGGCAVKIPYQWAMDQGFKKIVVVRTQHVDYRKKMPGGFIKGVTKRLYHKFPEFEQSLLTMNERYNAQCEELIELHKSGRIYMISPSKPLNVGRLESDLNKLAETYYLGFNDFKEKLNDVRAYLEL